MHYSYIDEPAQLVLSSLLTPSFGQSTYCCVAAWLRALSLRLSLMQIGQVILGQRLSPKQLTEDEIAAITHPVTCHSEARRGIPDAKTDDEQYRRAESDIDLANPAGFSRDPDPKARIEPQDQGLAEPRNDDRLSRVFFANFVVQIWRFI